MMSSNILSRLLPANPPGRSIYEDLRAHDEASESDIEEQAGMAVDEENLSFRDDELENADVFDGEDSRITTGSTARPLAGGRPLAGRQNKKAQKSHSKWITRSPRLLEEDGDDDVPASLLIEGNDPSSSRPRKSEPNRQRKQAAVPGAVDRETRAHWEATQAQQRLHQEEEVMVRNGPQTARPTVGLLTSNPREKAIWRWINITNLDSFIRDVYDYYTGSGIWCIVLTRVLDML
jgi:autophagy-related protein 9